MSANPSLPASSPGRTSEVSPPSSSGPIEKKIGNSSIEADSPVTTSNLSLPSISPPSSSTRKRNHRSVLAPWPKKISKTLCNKVTAKHEGDWSTIESVTIGEEKYAYQEYVNCDYELDLILGMFTLTTGRPKFKIPCKLMDTNVFLKAKLLYSSVSDFPQVDDVDGLLMTPYRPQRGPEPDSDGEERTDHERMPEFAESEILTVNLSYKRLFFIYQNALRIGLYNCIGKEFLRAACEYVGMCHLESDKLSRFQFRYCTSTGEYQPGALSITWSIPSKDIRSSSERKIVDSVKDRYADFVAFDSVDGVHVIVAEVKADATAPIESQNNEEMIGLWTSKQTAMLGLEVQGITARPYLKMVN